MAENFEICGQVENHGEESDAHQAISIEEYKDLFDGIQEKRKKQPQLLKTTAGSSKCCIFRIPQSLREINPQAYHPHIVSIGPYHRGQEELKMVMEMNQQENHPHKASKYSKGHYPHDEKDLKMMEEHKWRFLDSFLARSEEVNGLGLDDFLRAMAKLEEEARECYSEVISMDSKSFVQMLLLDGCFIVELLRRYDEEVGMEIKEDPIFYIPWVIPFLMRDLLRLENQLPFFVLQRLFDLSNAPNGKDHSSLPVLAIKFFNWAIDRPSDVYQWSIGRQYDHLLDLFRATFIPPYLKEPEGENESAKLLHCVSKLLRAGIEFKPFKDAKSFLEIRFKRGVLEIPKLTIDDFISSFFQNCIAYEQSHQYCGMYFTTFATFMDCLIDTDKDVALLGDERIIDNYFGTDDDVAKFFNELGRDVIFDIESCYLAKDFEEVNKYYRSSLHVRVAEFKSTYFNSPWSFISALAALILLILTITQTTFTIFPYYHPRS